MTGRDGLDALVTRIANVRGGLDAVLILLDATPAGDHAHARAVAALALAEAGTAHRLAAALLDRLDNAAPARPSATAPAPGTGEANA